MTTNVETQLAALQLAALEAKTHEEVLDILTQISAIEANASPTQLNTVAHTLLGIAVNPDKLRNLLRLMETRRPGAFDFIERTVAELRDGEPFPLDADGETWES